MLALNPEPPISVGQFIVSYAFGSWLRSAALGRWATAGLLCGYVVVALLERSLSHD